MAILARKSGSLISVSPTDKPTHWKVNEPSGEIIKVNKTDKSSRVFEGEMAVYNALLWIADYESLSLVNIGLLNEQAKEELEFKRLIVNTVKRKQILKYMLTPVNLMFLSGISEKEMTYQELATKLNQTVKSASIQVRKLIKLGYVIKGTQKPTAGRFLDTFRLHPLISLEDL